MTLPVEVICGDKIVVDKYDPRELAQIPKTRLGEGTLGSLFKVVLNCGSIVTIRKIRTELIRGADDLKLWINFFKEIRDEWLLPILFSFWYGGEAYVLYEYMCLGSLEELLHGTMGKVIFLLEKFFLCFQACVAFHCSFMGKFQSSPNQEQVVFHIVLPFIIQELQDSIFHNLKSFQL